MNLKFWGGWFLAIACVCIFLTMGCENGSLGVKYATVYGRLVNKDNIAMGVPNATVRMLSKETVSGKKSLSLATFDAQAVDNVTVSPYLTITDPPACFATSPVSTLNLRP